jgi:16S rRNA (cytidine1402-2'-O)-methyltransferase
MRSGHRKEIVAVTTGEKISAIGNVLYVVATPLGNLRDITLRALDILASVDVIAAEDTRVTSKLLARHGIATRMLSLHAHNERRRAAEIVSLLGSGKSVALVSDAGTPAVSDPGAALVRAVAQAGYVVVPVPGPSAVIAALSASGIAAPQWLFCGFLPATATARRAALTRLSDYLGALVFYEAPHRIAATLDALVAVLGPERGLVVARELTKRFETIHRCRLGEAPAWLAADPDRARGEFVLIVDAPGATIQAGDDADAHDRMLSTLLAELPVAQAVRLAVKLTGAPRNRLYERALKLSKDDRH